MNHLLLCRINAISGKRVIHTGETSTPRVALSVSLLLIIIGFVSSCSIDVHPENHDNASITTLDSLTQSDPDSALALIREYEAQPDLAVEYGLDWPVLPEAKLTAFQKMGVIDSIAPLIDELANQYLRNKDTLPLVDLLLQVDLSALGYTYYLLMAEHLNSVISYLRNQEETGLELIQLEITLINAYIHSDKFTDAKQLMAQLVTDGQKLNYPLLYNKLYFSLGTMYYKQKYYDLAKENFKKALAELNGKGSLDDYVNTMSNLALSYEILHQFDTAIVCYQTLLDTLPEEKQFDRLRNKLNLGNVYIGQGQFQLALDTYDEVLQASLQNQIQLGVVYSKLNMAFVYEMTEQYQRAIDIITALESDIIKYGDPDLLNEALIVKERAAHGAGQNTRAYAISKRIKAYEDSVKTTKHQTLINELAFVINKSNLELENQLLSSRIQRRNQWNLSLSILFLAVLALSGLIYHNYTKERQAALAYKELSEERRKAVLARDVAIQEKERLHAQLLNQERQKSNALAAKVDQLYQEMIQEAIRIDDEQGSQQFWINFSLKFKQLFPYFEEQLYSRFPNLTHNDIQYLKLVKMGLPQDALAQILNVVPRSLYRKRSRIIERMGLSEAESVDLLEYLPDE